MSDQQEEKLSSKDTNAGTEILEDGSEGLPLGGATLGGDSR